MRISGLALLGVVLLAGCTVDDPAAPGPRPGDPEVWFDGSYDGSVLELERTAVIGPNGSVIALDLVASRLVYDPERRRLSAVVHVRNSSGVDIYAPGRIAIGDFDPQGILPLNADAFEEAGPRWWYDYSDALGADGILSRNETSDGVEWRLGLPGPGSFSFAAMARFATEPLRPVISGRLFTDLDRDREPDADEPAGIGDIAVTGPEGGPVYIQPGDGGHWRLPVTLPGLYEVRWIEPPTAGFVPICLTTPNPLHVVLTAGPDGLPHGYERAHFGVDPEPCFPPSGVMPVITTTANLDSLETDPWAFVSLAYVPGSVGSGEHLEIGVGFGGCGYNHPLTFALFLPPDRADATILSATIVHDDLGEFCDAWFTVKRSVDLTLIRRLWREATGYEGPFQLQLHTPQGIETLEIP